MKNITARRLFAQIVMFGAINALALVRWGHPDPWSRIDRFSATAILMLLGMGSMTARMHGLLGQEARSEFFGERFDPLFLRLRLPLRLGEWLALFEYSHGLIVPDLTTPVVQVAGLAIAPGVMIWLWWVDSYLAAHFPTALAGTLMDDGPFRHIRHPRYGGLLAGRLAFAMLLGSAIGWVQFAIFAALFSRRMLREERHLLAAYPGRYDAYMKRTGRVIPRLTAKALER